MFPRLSLTSYLFSVLKLPVILPPLKNKTCFVSLQGNSPSKGSSVLETVVLWKMYMEEVCRLEEKEQRSKGEAGNWRRLHPYSLTFIFLGDLKVSIIEANQFCKLRVQVPVAKICLATLITFLICAFFFF